MSDDEVVRLQSQLRAFLRRLRSEQPSVEGLSRGAVRLLHVTHRIGGETTPGIVADMLGMTSSNVAPLLRELETAGYVRREREPDDARRVRVILTDRGMTVFARSREGREEWLRAAIRAALDARERDLLFAAGDLLERLAEASTPGIPHEADATREGERR
jgi:DNA-binding MarR family transcriptional regulator